MQTSSKWQLRLAWCLVQRFQEYIKMQQDRLWLRKWNGMWKAQPILSLLYQLALLHPLFQLFCTQAKEWKFHSQMLPIGTMFFFPGFSVILSPISMQWQLKNAERSEGSWPGMETLFWQFMHHNRRLLRCLKIVEALRCESMRILQVYCYDT